jgi:hypothetical protein
VYSIQTASCMKVTSHNEVLVFECNHLQVFKSVNPSKVKLLQVYK